MSNDLKCPICGKPTRVWYGNARKDGLCAEHADLANAGKLILCKKCGKYHSPDEQCEKKNIYTELPTDGFEKCVVCGKPSNGKPQCKTCYEETKSFINTLDKNGNVRKFRDYYYNLKERILIIRDIETAQEQCNKLIAIAMTNQNTNDDSSLMDRVYKDADTLIKGKKTPIIKTKEIQEKQKESDKNKIRINTAKDGHNVDSDMEVRIDDTLYNLNILHCYGKNIDEIIEKPKKCDWFIPIIGTDDTQGIFIEYWGMDTKDYLEDRTEKEELYKKHNLAYISIEKDDPKKDTQTFESNLKRELTKKAIEHFGFMPKWHKVN